VALRVHVDKERFVTQARHAGGEVDARCRLPAAALLVDDCDGSHARPSLVSRDVSRQVVPSTKNEITPDPAELIGPVREKTLGL